MAHRKYDGIQQLATGTGAGALTLGAATSAIYRRLQDAGIANGDTIYLRVAHETISAEWEVCLWTYNAGGITPTFDGKSSSATGSLISFSAGNKIVSGAVLSKAVVTEDNNGDATVTRDLFAGRAIVGTTSVSSNPAAASKGYVALFAGTASQAGYVAIFKGDGTTRLGLIGFNNTDLSISADSPATMVLDSSIIRTSGSLGIGRVPGYTLDVNGNIVRLSDGSTGYAFALYGMHATASNNWHAGSEGDGYFNWYNGNVGAGTARLKLASAGHLLPAGDNSQTLGDGSRRWSVVYAGTGVINTSGRAAKVNIREASDAEKRAARRILDGGTKLYQLVEAVEKKGDAARIHAGYVAEDVHDALVAEGLDPWRYAFLCHDEIVVQEKYTETATRPKVRKVTATEHAIEVRDGKAYRVAREVERDEPVGQLVPLFDELGQPVMQYVQDPQNPNALRYVPVTHFVPELEEYEIERTRERKTGEYRLGLRYSELEAFLRCAD